MKKLIVKNIKWFIIITILSTIIWTSIFQSLNAAKNYEKIQIFISADNVKSELLNNDILNHIPIKEVQIYKCNEDNTYYATYLETSGIMSSDILIINKTLVETKGSTTSFIELDNKMMEKYNINLDSFEVIKVDGKVHAIVVYDKSKNINLLDKYFAIDEANQDEVYCLVLNALSYHVGFSSNRSENLTEYAYEAISIMLNTNK